MRIRCRTHDIDIRGPSQAAGKTPVEFDTAVASVSEPAFVLGPIQRPIVSRISGQDEALSRNLENASQIKEGEEKIEEKPPKKGLL